MGKVIGNMKNGPRSLFSFRDMKAQTSMRSKKRKMSQKSAKSENVHFLRKFISRWKWMNFGAVVDGYNGRKMSKKMQVGNSCNSFKMFLNFLTLTPNISKKCPWKIFATFGWINQVEGGEHEYGRKPEVVFAAILWEKQISRFFWEFLVPVARGLGGRYLGP